MQASIKTQKTSRDGKLVGSRIRAGKSILTSKAQELARFNPDNK